VDRSLPGLPLHEWYKMLAQQRRRNNPDGIRIALEKIEERILLIGASCERS